MKKLFSALAAVLTLAAGAADAALTALAPADYKLALSVDVRRMLGNRDVQQTIAKPDLAKLFAEAERAGLRIARIRELTVFFWDNHWYGAMRMDDAGRLREILEKESAGKNAKIAAEDIDGKRVYRLKRPEEKRPRRRNKELCLVFWDADIVLIAKTAELRPFLSCPRLAPAEAARLADTDAEAWFSYRNRGAAKPKDDSAGLVGMDLKNGDLELRLAGPSRRDVEIVGSADFGDPVTAKSMSMTLPGIMAFFLGLVLNDDPQTADRIVRALRTEVDGGGLLLKLEAPDEVVQRFLASLESFLGGKKRRHFGIKRRGGR